jgi:xylan 1,4-beta-xylosidase
VTWAFEFEDQPYFDGFRTLATNGIDKPVLNFFRMAGQMTGDSLKVESDAAVPAAALTASGVRDKPAVDALATVGDHKIDVLVWNYHDDDLGGQDAAVDLRIAGMPSGAKRVLLRHYRIDAENSNAYSTWKEMGSPPSPSPDQYAKLERSGQLELLSSPRWLESADAAVNLNFTLPRQGLSLLELSW